MEWALDGLLPKSINLLDRRAGKDRFIDRRYFAYRADQFELSGQEATSWPFHSVRIAACKADIPPRVKKKAGSSRNVNTTKAG
jgi:hypothetical protein